MKVAYILEHRLTRDINIVMEWPEDLKLRVTNMMVIISTCAGVPSEQEAFNELLGILPRTLLEDVAHLMSISSDDTPLVTEVFEVCERYGLYGNYALKAIQDFKIKLAELQRAQP